MAELANFSSKLTFYLNGTSVELVNPDPDLTLLQYVRSVGLTGTKLGCAEGGCGACTVMVSSYDPITREIIHNSVNACLAPLCSMDGKHVVTIEGIGNIQKPHPVQERIALMHGSQCGFCTPGIAMSLYVLLRNNPNPTEKEIEECFDGNLCRCTGYRPILDAAKTESVKIKGCGLNKCCKLNDDINNGDEFNFNFPKVDFIKYDPSQELIFPPPLMKYSLQPLYFIGRKTTWFRPVNLEQLLKLKSKYPASKIVSGNTEVGIETKFKKMKYNVQIYVSDISELKTCNFQDDGILIGGNISLSKFQKILQDALFKSLMANLRWFSGNQIRNVATPAGNIVTGSPISDLNPIFLSTQTKFILKSENSTRTIPSSSFWTSYRQNILSNIEILHKIFIPCSKLGQYVRAYKQAKRRDDDISIVNAGFSVLLDNNNTVREALFAFGGMSGVTMRAYNSEKFVLNKKWGDEVILNALISNLYEELQLSFSTPGGMPSYRRSLVAGFIYKFWYDIANSVGIKAISDENFFGIIEREISKGIQLIGKSNDDKKPIGKTIPHISAMKQVTGTAIYTDDIPKVHGELYGALLLSQKPHAKILNIDAIIALSQPGVKGFFTAKDVPGQNIWGPVSHDEEVFARQIIGLIVAENQSIAQEAVNLVKVEYEELPYILSIEEAIENNSFFPVHRTINKGDVDKALKEADFVFEGETRIGGQEHFYLETNSSLVIPKSEDNEFEIHVSTQNPTETQLICASVLGIPANKIVCRVKRLGGGFGGKETRSIPLTLALTVGAWHLKRPIRCMLDRDEDIIISGQRHPFLAHWRVGVNKDGKFVAFDLQIYNNAGWSRDLSSAVVERAITHSDNCYYIPNFRVVGRVCRTNIHSNTAFRGFGGPQGMMITENIINEVADQLGMDAIELRQKNFYKEEQKTHYNQILKDWHIPAIYQQVIETGDYYNRRKEMDVFNSRNRWRKKGLALIPTKFGISYTTLHLNQAGALVHIYNDGSVLISHGGVEMGQGLHTKMIQIASEALDIPIENVHIMETSTNLVANTSATAASVSSDINGYALANACKILAERLKPYHRVNLSANGFYKTPDIGYDWDKNEGNLFFYFTTGVALTEVEIDVLTGDHQILRTDLCMDIGRSLNYAIDIGQIEGAFIQGVGWCTIEETLFFPNGHIFTKGPGNYKIPGFRDIPQDFRISTFNKAQYSSLKTIHSSKGVGEPPLFLGSSVYYAIRDAIKYARKANDNHKVVVLQSPATPEKIRLACMDKLTKAATVEPKDGEKEWIITGYALRLLPICELPYL
ncbi:16119_t:CDS:10 [Entrophospora sp. SA101]|nr:2584_t:CDS:10 [Entrophospora sp. SA101]CAJ0633010.1 16119_t:CDS:10 [Entrophospora sp. SA101]CAJ0833068.1 4378_t:CDS:10 [Entrophospora sp. SA101]